jgi:8-oxo-dGTP diphosphatase
MGEGGKGMNKPLVMVSAAALIRSDSEILIAQRPLHKNMGGLWEFPGGKLEAGESPETALQRELQEELGIQVKIEDLLPITFVSHDYNKFYLLMMLYGVYHGEGQLSKNDHEALAWVDVSELEKYPMPPADIPLIVALEKFVKTEC